MRSLIILAALVLAGNVSEAKDTYVHGYTNSNGTYVEPHHRTAPDNTLTNNYSTQGNTNPYTGKAGTVNPYGSTFKPLKTTYGNDD